MKILTNHLRSYLKHRIQSNDIRKQLKYTEASNITMYCEHIKETIQKAIKNEILYMDTKLK